MKENMAAWYSAINEKQTQRKRKLSLESGEEKLKTSM